MGEGEKPLQAFRGKAVSIMAASAGALGGMRVLVVLKMLLGNIGMHVLPNQRAIGKVNTLVDEKGDLVDEKTINQIHKAAAELVDMANRLK
jgi:NAD(P)H-dependent FMN reductase